MPTQVMPGHGLVVDESDLEPTGDTLAAVRARRAAAVTLAEDYLIESGTPAWQVAELDLLGRTRQAWWDDDRGFVGKNYPGARSVLVVEMPAGDDNANPPHEPEAIEVTA